MSLFKSLFGIAEDVVTIAAAPVQVVADLTRAVTKPVADLAKETADGVSEMLDSGDKK